MPVFHILSAYQHFAYLPPALHVIPSPGFEVPCSSEILERRLPKQVFPGIESRYAFGKPQSGKVGGGLAVLRSSRFIQPYFHAGSGGDTH